MKEKLKQNNVGEMLRRRPNTQSGITLIALIITIIILLILAIVSISLIINQGILDKSKKAVDQYAEAEGNEQAKLLQAEYEMAKYEGKTTGSFTDYVLGKKGLKVGDYVDYKVNTSKQAVVEASECGVSKQTFNAKTLGWKILGTDSNGNIQLISDTTDTSAVNLSGITGWKNAETILNRICDNLYTTDKGIARSLNTTDINRLANYTPELQYTWKFKLDQGIRYYVGQNNVQGSKDGGSTWGESYATSLSAFGIDSLEYNSSDEMYYGYQYTYNPNISDSIIKNIIKGDGKKYQYLATRRFWVWYIWR